MIINLVGQTYGRWTVLEFVGKNKHRFAVWKCRCSCGTEKNISSNELRSGSSRSCGCLQRETASRVGKARAGYNRTHGMANTPEYGAYHSAKQRCQNPKCDAYPNYGGRGIEFRFGTFQAFIDAVGLRPSDEHSLDRIDVNGHYEAGNLRWATSDVQMGNRRVKRIEDFSMAELLDELRRRNWTATVNQYLAEERSVSGGKGDDTLKQQESAQAAFTNTLMQSYRQQFAKQSSILDFLTSKMKPLIENPQGFSPEALTTMRTQASDTNARQFTNASQALNTALTARTGATTLPSGVDAQLKAQLAASGAATEANAQNDITLQNENLKQQNFWSALNVLGGNAAMFNPTGYANSANSGSGEVSDLGTAFKNSQSSQLLGALGGIAGGVGSAVGSYVGGKH